MTQVLTKINIPNVNIAKEILAHWKPKKTQAIKDLHFCESRKIEITRPSMHAPQIRQFGYMKTALSKIKWQSVKQQSRQIFEQKQVKLALEFKGSAQRCAANKRKAIRFTEEQRQIMDRCLILV